MAVTALLITVVASLVGVWLVSLLLEALRRAPTAVVSHIRSAG